MSKMDKMGAWDSLLHTDATSPILAQASELRQYEASDMPRRWESGSR